jgi:MoxR-like ATPase
MARVSMGYPAMTSEMAMLDSHGSADPLQTLAPVSDAQTIQRAVAAAAGVHASYAVKQYLLDLVTATRAHPDLALGASPRASLHLLRAVRAAAAIDGRRHVLPDDVQDFLVPVLAHRLLLTADAQLGQRTVADVLTGLLRTTPVPAAGSAA